MDGPDPDDEPDLIPASGTVKFVPKTPYLVNVTADPNPPATPTIPIKVREGSTWVTRNARPKVRRNDAWEPAVLKRWTGTTWQ